MAESDVRVRPRRSRTEASAAVDHVRLSYHYLDIGDIDGYGSLFGEQVVLRCSGEELRYGRDELERYERQRLRAGRARHTVFDVVASGRFVIAVGSVDRSGVRPPAAAVSLDFIDVFKVSDDGLITARRRFTSRVDRP